jgi:DNA-binding transcriptional LysR family regulator
MRLEQLKALCWVVETGSFSRAATLLHVSQPAISISVRELEREFGAQLLERRPGRPRLTPLGEKVYPIAREVVQRIQDLEQFCQQSRQLQARQVTLLLAATASAYLLAQPLAEFRLRQPEAHITVRLAETQVVLDELLADLAHIGVLISPEPHPQLEPVCCWPDELLVVVPPRHPWARGRVPGTEELLAQNWILPLPSGATRRLIDTRFRQHLGAAPRALMQVGNPEALKRAVLTSGEPGIVLRTSCVQELAIGALVPVAVPVDLSCVHTALIRRGRHLEGAARDVAALLRSVPGGETWGLYRRQDG